MTARSVIDVVFYLLCGLVFTAVAVAFLTGKTVGTVIGTALGWVMSFVGGVFLPKKARRRLYRKLRICQKRLEERRDRI